MNIQLTPLQEHEKETFIGIITVRQKKQDWKEILPILRPLALHQIILYSHYIVNYPAQVFHCGKSRKCNFGLAHIDSARQSGCIEPGMPPLFLHPSWMMLGPNV